MEPIKDLEVLFLRKIKPIDFVNQTSPRMASNYKTEYAKRLSKMLYEIQLKDEQYKWT